MPKVSTPSWATRRVAAGTAESLESPFKPIDSGGAADNQLATPPGSTPARRPLQLSSRFFEAQHKDNLKAASLSALPNATQADFWLRKARNLQNKGEIKVRVYGVEVVFKQGLI